MSNVIKSEIKLDVNGRDVAAYLASPQTGGKGVLVLHAWWGLKPFFKQVCEQLAGQGFTVLAPDLRNGEIAQTIQAAEELMRKSDQQFTGAIVEAARDHLLLNSSTGAPLGVVGFSMGAAWALEVAGNAPDKFAAIVAFYGSGQADYGKMQAKFMGHFCEEDEWEPAEYIREMEDDMRSAGVEATFHFYPGVSHWFMEDDRPEYNPAQARLAWERTYRFLKETLLPAE
ncbi:MAG TPA: dienelactone hydrolase family protein [Anaerolineales bacterium]